MAIRKNATERTAPTKNVAVTYLKSVRHVFLQLAQHERLQIFIHRQTDRNWRILRILQFAQELYLYEIVRVQYVVIYEGKFYEGTVSFIIINTRECLWLRSQFNKNRIFLSYF
jgi:hypothetical protein